MLTTGSQTRRLNPPACNRRMGGPDPCRLNEIFAPRCPMPSPAAPGVGGHDCSLQKRTERDGKCRSACPGEEAATADSRIGRALVGSCSYDSTPVMGRPAC